MIFSVCIPFISLILSILFILSKNPRPSLAAQLIELLLQLALTLGRGAAPFFEDVVHFVLQFLAQFLAGFWRKQQCDGRAANSAE